MGNILPSYTPRTWTGGAGALPGVNLPTIPILKANNDNVRRKHAVGQTIIRLIADIAEGGAGAIWNALPVAQAMQIVHTYEQAGRRRRWQMRGDLLQLTQLGQASFAGFPAFQLDQIVLGVGDTAQLFLEFGFSHVDPLGDGEISLGSIVEVGIQGTIPIPAGGVLTGWQVQVLTYERPRDPRRTYMDTFRIPFTRNATLSPDVIGGGAIETLCLSDGAGLGALVLSKLDRGSTRIVENCVVFNQSQGLDAIYDDGVNLTATLAAAAVGAGPANKPFWILRDSRSSLGQIPMGDVTIELSSGTAWPAGTLYAGVMKEPASDTEIVAHEAETREIGQAVVAVALDGKRPLTSMPPALTRYVNRRSTPSVKFMPALQKPAANMAAIKR